MRVVPFALPIKNDVISFILEGKLELKALIFCLDAGLILVEGL